MRPRLPQHQLRVWTIWELRDHCLITLRGCWEWRLRPGIAPSSEHARRYVSVKHEGKVTTARRLAYELTHGPVPDGMRVVPARCQNPRCQNPWHAKPMTESQKNKLAAERGAFATQERAEAIAKGKQASTRTGMTMEKADRIRRITGRADDHLDEFGICRAMFNRIRRNLAWIDPTLPSPLPAGSIPKPAKTGSKKPHNLGRLWTAATSPNRHDSQTA